MNDKPTTDKVIDGITLLNQGHGDYTVEWLYDLNKLLRAHKVKVMGEGTAGHWVRLTDPKNERRRKIAHLRHETGALQKRILKLEGEVTE